MAMAIGASALVVNKKGEILLTQRHDLRVWVFPGGGISHRFPITLNKLPSYFWRRTLGKKLGLVKL